MGGDEGASQVVTTHPLIGFGNDFVVLLSEVINRNQPSSPICMASEFSEHTLRGLRGVNQR